MIAYDCINLYGSTYNCPPPGSSSDRGGRTCLLLVLIFGLWIACGGLNSQIALRTKALLVLLEKVSFRFCMHSKCCRLSPPEKPFVGQYWQPKKLSHGNSFANKWWRRRWSVSNKILACSKAAFTKYALKYYIHWPKVETCDELR